MHFPNLNLTLIALCLEYRVSWVRVPPRQLIYSRKSDCLGCAALFVCLTLLTSFFLPSHLSLKTCTYTLAHGVVSPITSSFANIVPLSPSPPPPPRLPIESGGGGEGMVVEDRGRGRKKEAVLQCALKACRILDSHDMLHPASKGGLKIFCG